METTPATRKLATSLITIIRKDVKEANVRLASEEKAMSSVTSWISSGFMGVDKILGGGWAVGRASETSGPEGCGKSALAESSLICCQAEGGLGLYLDFEHAVETAKFVKDGVNLDALIYEQPDHIEQGWSIVWSFLAGLHKNPPKAPALIVWDSVGGALTKDMLEADPDERTVASVAGVMTPNCAKLYKALGKVNAHMMFINQERVTMGGFKGFGGTPKHTPGGGALKYCASQRVRCARVSTLKDGSDGPATGYLIKTTTEKNKIAPPHRKAAWVLDFGVGPSPELTFFEVLKDAGKLVAVQNSPGMYNVRGFKGPPVNRSGWAERLGRDHNFDIHVQALYLDVFKNGAGKIGAASSAD